MNAAMHVTACQILAAMQRASMPRPRRQVATYTSAKPSRKCGSFKRYASNRCCAGCHGVKNGGARL
jgi:hypothetical protein